MTGQQQQQPTSNRDMRYYAPALRNDIRRPPTPELRGPPPPQHNNNLSNRQPTPAPRTSPPHRSPPPQQQMTSVHHRPPQPPPHRGSSEGNGRSGSTQQLSSSHITPPPPTASGRSRQQQQQQPRNSGEHYRHGGGGRSSQKPLPHTSPPQQHPRTHPQQQQQQPHYQQYQQYHQQQLRNRHVQRQGSLNRSRTLSRPDRYRPRPGMVRNTPPPLHGGRGAPMGPPPHRGLPFVSGSGGARNPGTPHPVQPMSNRLQQQLQQQKLQQQREAGLAAPRPIPANMMAGGRRRKQQVEEEEEEEPDVLTSWWAWIAFLVTCCIPGWCMKTCFRKRTKLIQQAWREKMALVMGILLLCGVLIFITYGLTLVLCPESRTNTAFSAVENGERRVAYYKNPRVFGRIYDMDVMKNFFAMKGLNLTNDYENMDLGPIFNGDAKGACPGNVALGPCRLDSPYGGSLVAPDGQCLSVIDLNRFATSTSSIGFDWFDLQPESRSLTGPVVLLGNNVLNLTTYNNNGTAIFGDYVDKVLTDNLGTDISYVLLYEAQGKRMRDCLLARYSAGVMESDTGGCIAAQIIMNIMLAVIVCMIVIRYSMALTFLWFIAGRLVKPGGRSNWLAWRSIKGGNEDPLNHIPGPYAYYNPQNMGGSNSSSTSVSSTNSSAHYRQRNQQHHGTSTPPTIRRPDADIVKTELYTVMLVTCYSEGYEGLRTTMDSLAKTTYSNKHKCFFVVCDGMITGAGESRSTPDIIIDMMDLDPTMREPKSSSYVAIADGERQLNMAKVYAGHYRGVPCVAVIKCGTEEEANKPKAGNRGKRDSQLIIMQFFQRVLFNDRLSELDYEIFWKMTWLMRGVTPDKFELVLMVDADTKVLPDAITYMVAAMANDITIMGLCGETRIANKLASWVSAIQVFEYYISHNYAKAFESLFGIVTCLPGCFSMYRIKAPKNGAWVPILANPDIILEYNQNIVTTLHAKNLLLLGEDRFLSTLMLRTFPRRQMMYVPQARCKTIVPESFKVLLSQRRRWINSTVHNLMELVLVSDLCGIACLSMQFSVFVDLIGTLVLPAAICLTVYLIVNTAISTNPQWQSLALLIAILGLPAVLIAITTFKLVYIMWMMVYLVALPIWNFVLPIYSYWHFDDFSWGATRKVAGEKKDKGHMDAEGKFDSSRLVMKKWEDWEAERTGQKIMPRNRLTLITPHDPIPPPGQSYPPGASPYQPHPSQSSGMLTTPPMFVNRQRYTSPINTPPQLSSTPPPHH
ncbi:chitin synthase-domain-containing protein [Phascolomyces articulosus]|uniref:chitin synthase n=1 Tax=Phascolomyces articulosus TaxID=60185 RepID=A0AAD5K443_9FUNG|nr:chitin synthase-domain-containing protein [Phascolomyces articulosus]